MYLRKMSISGLGRWCIGKLGTKRGSGDEKHMLTCSCHVILRKSRRRPHFTVVLQTQLSENHCRIEDVSDNLARGVFRHGEMTAIGLCLPVSRRSTIHPRPPPPSCSPDKKAAPVNIRPPFLSETVPFQAAAATCVAASSAMANWRICSPRSGRSSASARLASI